MVCFDSSVNPLFLLFSFFFFSVCLKPCLILSSVGKGKGRKECETDVHTDNSASVQLEPVTVELRVELEKWRSASEARQLLLPLQNLWSKQPVLSKSKISSYLFSVWSTVTVCYGTIFLQSSHHTTQQTSFSVVPPFVFLHLFQIQAFSRCIFKLFQHLTAVAFAYLYTTHIACSICQLFYLFVTLNQMFLSYKQPKLCFVKACYRRVTN